MQASGEPAGDTVSGGLAQWIHLRARVGRQGSCSGALPVGMRAFRRAGAAPQPAPAAHASAAPPAAAGARAAPPALGDDADAAWREPAVLAGVGALLPGWRRLAELLAPVLHPARPRPRSRGGPPVALQLARPGNAVTGCGRQPAAGALCSAAGVLAPGDACSEASMPGLGEGVLRPKRGTVLESAAGAPPRLSVLDALGTCKAPLPRSGRPGRTAAPGGAAAGAARRWQGDRRARGRRRARPAPGALQRRGAGGRRRGARRAARRIRGRARVPARDAAAAPRRRAGRAGGRRPGRAPAPALRARLGLATCCGKDLASRHA